MFVRRPMSLHGFVVVLLLLIIIILPSSIKAEKRGWQYKVGRYAQTIPKFDDRLFAFDPSTIYINYITQSNRLMNFNGQLETLEIMVRLCRSTSTLNKYGFERWKDNIFTRVEVRTDEIRLIWQKNPAFVLAEDEMVLCGPLRNPDDSTELYYSSRDNETPQPAQFSFVFGRSNLKPALVMTGTNLRYGDKIDESNIRRDGLQLTLTYTSDVWNIEERDHIFESFSCEPNNCLNGILRKEHINITEAEPHILRIDLSSLQTLDFNINLHSTISFVPSTKTSYKGVTPENRLENFAFKVDKLNSSPDIRIAQPKYPQSGYVIPHLEDGPENAVVFYEKCIRNKDPLKKCTVAHRTINVQLYSENDVSAGSSIFEAAFTSTMKPVNVSTFNDTFYRVIDGWVQQPVKVNDKTALVPLAVREEFDVWQEEMIQYDIPPVLIADLEPPINGPFFIKFIPSPGVIIWSPNKDGTTDVTESMFWDGGHVMTIELDGEIWDEDVVRELLIPTSTSTSIGANPDGWERYKHSVVPTVNITFPLPNTTQLTFVRELRFDIDEPETVTFTITPEMTKSKLTPEGDGPKLQFTIGKSPGRGIMDPDRRTHTIHERDVWSGDIVFNLTLTGEKWIDGEAEFKACKEALLKDLYSNQTGQKGFAVDSNRAKFLSAPNVFDRLDSRSVRFNAHAVPIEEYDIETGEVIILKSGVVPLVCLTNKNPEELPKTNLEMDIIPQNALIDVYWVKNGRRADKEMEYRAPYDPNATDLTEANKTITVKGISETYLRGGKGLTFVVTADLDYFDTTKFSKQTIFDDLIADGVESTGWRYKKSSLTSPANIDISNRSEIRVTFPDLYAPFDISVDELVTLIVKPEWMISRRRPNANPMFAIYVAPGLAELITWSGEKEGVTENDVRRGLVNFTFSLLGDSWRQQRQPFIDSIIPLNDTKTGMSRYKASVIPGVDFFTFSYKEGVERAVIQFQAVPEYDIAADERVALRFSNSSVASFLMPSVEPSTDDLGFVFTVKATRGEMVLSGLVDGVQEKYIRQGLVTAFVTLFGETFNTNVASELIYNSLVGTSASPTGFNALKSTIVSRSTINATETHATIVFTSNTAFNIDTETIQFNFPPGLFASGVVPYSKRRPVIEVQSSGGELTYEIRGLNPGEPLTEDHMRVNGLGLRLKLLGDTWNQYAISRQPYTFFSGFSASAPVLTEPRGFNANFYYWTPNITFIDESTLELYLCANCSGIDYNIAEDESISFGIGNSIFVNSALPQPNTVSFKVVMVPRDMILVFDEGSVTWSAGRITVPEFQRELSNFLSVPPERIKANMIDTANTKQIKMHFSNPLTAEDGASLDDQNDVRTSTELSDLLLGINESFTIQNLFIVQKYYADMPPPDNDTVVTLAPTVEEDTGEEPLMDGPYGTMVWAGGVACFLGSIGLFMYCSSLKRRGDRPGSLRPGSNPSTHQRKMGHAAAGVQYDRGDERYGMMEGLDPHKVFSGQGKFTARRPRVNPLGNAGGVADQQDQITSLKDHVRRKQSLAMEAEEEEAELGHPKRKLLMPKRTVFSYDSDDD